MKQWFYHHISGRTIQSKLTVIFAVIILLFNIVTISIYVSSNQLMKQYHDSFTSLLRLNTISQTAIELSDATKAYVLEREQADLAAYYDTRSTLKEQVEPLLTDSTPIQYKNYTNMIDALIYQSELTVGFVLRDDIEQYTAHMKEVQSTANYIQETTLELLDTSLTDYQTLYVDMQERNQMFKYFTLFLLITSIIFGGYIAIRFARGIHRPVEKLSEAAKEVSDGHFDGELIQIDSSDELQLLGDSFNNMRTNIQQLIKEIKGQSEQDMLMKELELKHLQNQIHPHFLFNTLNTVAKMAYLEDAPSTSDLIESLASMMRHSLGDLHKFVHLEDELKMVHDYVHIQRMRFMERIEFEMEPLADHLNIVIPRLTLQPIVENAFIHGLESLEQGGKIKVNMIEKANEIWMEVKDNGVGISEEEKERLLQMKDEEHIGHVTGIGLANVIKRLQLFYQEEHVMEIDSTIGKGTTIRLILPKQPLVTEQ
ncbi:sensor histidine kinase [Gracilibacillus caseinilyticus]|uniref:histidine kinase n=1 Tax=Gracilibacillus caseinilyticus TaxID=2932256 RepID=A0ABY4F2A4_9BACI|nr:sensor histidine kinase [Gracilibacillus caseinilyticus]UOQ50307.1 sensor histidine kinase [Gracilibacillus caseinilyticus]